MKRVLFLLPLLLLSGCFNQTDPEVIDEIVQATEDETSPSADTETETDQELSPTGRVILRNVEDAGAFGFFSGGLDTTDTSVHSVDLDDVLSGGPPKDGIPALHDPAFETQQEAGDWLDDENLGILYQEGEQARFYPYAVLYYHEIANDVVNGQPISVTFCPLCGSAIVFDRTVDGKVEQFGVSGKLWESNLLMYDFKTESLWSQILGEAVVGERTGEVLSVLPADTLTFAEVKENFPNADVLSKKTGYRDRDYGDSPYGNYETNDALYFPVKGLSGDKAEAFQKKELFIASTAIPGQTIGFMRADLLEEKEAKLKVDGVTVEAKVLDDGTVQLVNTKTGEQLSQFVTMWFSLFAHLGEDEVVVWSK